MNFDWLEKQYGLTMVQCVRQFQEERASRRSAPHMSEFGKFCVANHERADFVDQVAIFWRARGIVGEWRFENKSVVASLALCQEDLS